MLQVVVLVLLTLLAPLVLVYTNLLVHSPCLLLTNSKPLPKKIAPNVAIRLNDIKKTFSGDLDESWMEYVDDYHQMCNDYGISPYQKFQYLHNILGEDAKIYYFNIVDDFNKSF